MPFPFNTNAQGLMSNLMGTRGGNPTLSRPMRPIGQGMPDRMSYAAQPAQLGAMPSPMMQALSAIPSSSPDMQAYSQLAGMAKDGQLMSQDQLAQMAALQNQMKQQVMGGISDSAVVSPVAFGSGAGLAAPSQMLSMAPQGPAGMGLSAMPGSGPMMSPQQLQQLQAMQASAAAQPYNTTTQSNIMGQPSTPSSQGIGSLLGQMQPQGAAQSQNLTPPTPTPFNQPSGALAQQPALPQNKPYMQGAAGVMGAMGSSGKLF